MGSMYLWEPRLALAGVTHPRSTIYMASEEKRHMLLALSLERWLRNGKGEAGIPGLTKRES